MADEEQMDVGENPTISEENESIAASKPNQQVATDNSGEESESDSSDEDLPDVDDEGILELQKAIEGNPFHYDSHVKLIEELRSRGDLERLRKARESMAETFPLTEELWIEWFKDEVTLMCIPDHKEYLRSLFEKSLLDYTSVRVWLQYCQFVMDSIASSAGVEDVRAIYERAITAVGIHLTEGSSVWNSYREFEMTLLESFQALQDASGTDAKIEAQISRVESIYRRQLAVPLLEMEETWQEYEDWTSEPIPESVKNSYEKASAKLEKCLSFEDKLSTATPPKLAEYQDYIACEVKDGDPARIQCIFERAIKENCLDAELWQQYTEYLDQKLKLPSLAVAVHARAVRNVPWIFLLWNNYLKALERNKTDTAKVKEVFQKALGCGFSSSDNFVQLWLTYCDSIKRTITDWQTETDKTEYLKRTLEDAVQYIDHYFGIEGDKASLIRRYWAAVEAKFLGNLRKAQELWEAIMKIHGKETHMWLEYTHFLRLHSDVISCRRAFQRAIQTTVDDPERLFEAFVLFERIEGTFDQLDSAVQRSESQMKKIDKKRLKQVDVEADTLKTNIEKEERRKHNKLVKNRENKKAGKQQKILEKHAKKSDTHKEKKVAHKSKDQAQPQQHKPQQQQQQQQQRSAEDEPPSKKARVESTSDEQHERTDDDVEVDQTEAVKSEDKTRSEESMKRTVFLSNLLFAVDEDKVKETFKEAGEITEVRIVRNLLGRSKGYAYLEFKDPSAVEKALLMDRNLVNGRPMFVSLCIDKSKNQPQQFRYNLSLDKQTVFVTNLPFEATKEDIENIFKQVGEIKEVRIVTNRAGKPKGYAYIEYVSEACASTAVMNLDGHVMNQRPINVALSKPPARKPNEAHFDPRSDQSKPTHPGSRGRARTQLTLVPRSIHSHPPPTNAATTTQQEEKAPQPAKKSNDFFRNMFK